MAASNVTQVPWIRPKPGILPPSPAEFKMLHPGPEISLLWDTNMPSHDAELKVARELIHRALAAPLLPAQQQTILSLLEQDPKLVHLLGLTPERLPLLVEHTPILAYEILLCMLPSKKIHEYFQVLVQMELSLHSMEVVNRLTTAAELPTEFLHLYIINCINSCEGIQDKYLQNRLVRLVCVFLQSLIRNKIIDVAALLHEVAAFCINFSRIREAATLFRLLKQMELGTVPPAGPGDCSSSCSIPRKESWGSVSDAAHKSTQQQDRDGSPVGQ